MIATVAHTTVQKSVSYHHYAQYPSGWFFIRSFTNGSSTAAPLVLTADSASHHVSLLKISKEEWRNQLWMYWNGVLINFATQLAIDVDSMYNIKCCATCHFYFLFTKLGTIFFCIKKALMSDQLSAKSCVKLGQLVKDGILPSKATLCMASTLLLFLHPLLFQKASISLLLLTIFLQNKATAGAFWRLKSRSKITPNFLFAGVSSS